MKLNENSETPEAKFARIAEEIKKNADWRALLAGTYDDELQALDEIARHYGGETWHTGGNIYVRPVLPLGPHERDGCDQRVYLPLPRRDGHQHGGFSPRARQRHERRRGLACGLSPRSGIRRGWISVTRLWPNLLLASK